MSVFDKYGIKEVADVTFYHISDTTKKPDYPVLYLDSLKVSTIEQTAENVSARGGKGNPEIISWDYGKEITVTLEDALFSAKSMAIMFGNGKAASATASVMRTEYFSPTITAGVSDEDALASAGFVTYVVSNGKRYKKDNKKFYDANGAALTSGNLTKDEKYLCTYDLIADVSVITISGDSFPGTYYVTGDTYARSAATGNDDFFQFIIPKAKVTSENTITLEAEGDPSTFSMNLRVLRPENASEGMMKLVQYKLADGGYLEEDTSTTSMDIVHNHQLNPNNMGTE